MSLFNIKRILLLNLIKINYLLIPIFLFSKAYYLIYILLRLNLRKIRTISCGSEKRKFKVIVLPKSGGLDDLNCSFKKNNENIEFYQLPRPFIKAMFRFFIGESKNIADYKYFDASTEIISAKKRYRSSLVKIVSILKEKFKIDAFIGFNYNYFAEKELHVACKTLKIKFIILHKESVLSPNEELVVKGIYKHDNNKFGGYKIGVYSENEKKLIIKSNVATKQQVKVIGCARLDESFLIRKIKPKNKVVYFMVEDNRGFTHNFFKNYSKSFRKKFRFYNNPRYKNLNWEDLRKKTTDVVIQLAKENKNIEFVIKGKESAHSKNDLPSNLPSNCKLIFGGPGHKLLRDSKVIIGWSSTIILEAIAANRFILIPYFNLKNDSYKKNFEVDFKLNSENKGFDEKDFKKKFNIFIKAPYKVKKNNYNLSSVKFHLGNKDGKSGIRLNKFLKECLNEKRSNSNSSG